MNTTDIILTYLDTPRLWSASRKDSCGCPECMHLHQTGNTPEEALANLLEDESWREGLRGTLADSIAKARAR